MRSSGILLHITSLPNAYGIGDLGPNAYAMVRALTAAGQSSWQVLPVNPTDGINGHSPYSCSSAFAGNPLLISPELLVKQGFLPASQIKKPPVFAKADVVDYARAGAFKQRLLQRAFRRWVNTKDQKLFQDFCQDQNSWLEDYSVYAVAKDHFKGKSWYDWSRAMAKRQPNALAQFTKAHATDIKRVKFIQFLFYKQWHEFRAYANKAGIKIVGDIPIYVNYDSADVWCSPELFKLKENGELKYVSGCPPDYFSKTGQRWGNPVYDWERMKKDRYQWWIRRIDHNLSLFDTLRIDHFRGFLSFWQIPAHEKFAVFGRWTQATGEDFFKVLHDRFDHLPLIGEDLGEITPDVIALMRNYKIPGMRVLLFGFSGDMRTNPHAPANYPADCVAYTGTHDNNTIAGWYHSEAKPNEKATIANVLGCKVKVKTLHWAMIETLLKSRANMVIVPVCDILGLREDARMNTPATKINNWKWRLKERVLTKTIIQKMFKLTKQYKRI